MVGEAFQSASTEVASVVGSDSALRDELDRRNSLSPSNSSVVVSAIDVTLAVSSLVKWSWEGQSYKSHYVETTY